MITKKTSNERWTIPSVETSDSVRRWTDDLKQRLDEQSREILGFDITKAAAEARLANHVPAIFRFKDSSMGIAERGTVGDNALVDSFKLSPYGDGSDATSSKSKSDEPSCPTPMLPMPTMHILDDIRLKLARAVKRLNADTLTKYETRRMIEETLWYGRFYSMNNHLADHHEVLAVERELAARVKIFTKTVHKAKTAQLRTLAAIVLRLLPHTAYLATGGDLIKPALETLAEAARDEDIGLRYEATRALVKASAGFYNFREDTIVNALEVLVETMGAVRNDETYGNAPLIKLLDDFSTLTTHPEDGLRFFPGLDILDPVMLKAARRLQDLVASGASSKIRTAARDAHELMRDRLNNSRNNGGDDSGSPPIGTPPMSSPIGTPSTMPPTGLAGASAATFVNVLRHPLGTHILRS